MFIAMVVQTELYYSTLDRNRDIHFTGNFRSNSANSPTYVSVVVKLFLSLLLEGDYFFKPW